MYYAGIGSRETPIDILWLMRKSAAKLSGSHILRSGGAKGADKWFEIGAIESNGKREIFTAKDDIPLWAFATVDKYHPNPNALKEYPKKLHARNAMILFGNDINNKINYVDFVICWTKDGKDTGGTGQAIRIAEDYGIKIYNLFHKDTYDSFMQAVSEGV